MPRSPEVGSVTLGRLIRNRRNQLRLTQEELAERVGGKVTQSDVSQLERGAVTRPGRDRLARFALALQLPLADLVNASGWAELSRAVEEFESIYDPADPVRRPIYQAMAELSEDSLKSLSSFANYLLKQESDQRRRAKRAEGESA